MNTMPLIDVWLQMNSLKCDKQLIAPDMTPMAYQPMTVKKGIDQVIKNDDHQEYVNLFFFK